MTPYDQKIQELQERVRTGIGRNGYETWLLDSALIPQRVGYLAAVADYADLLAAAEVAARALHEYHPQEFRIRVGAGICTWNPCKSLFDALAKAKALAVQP